MGAANSSGRRRALPLSQSEIQSEMEVLRLLAAALHVPAIAVRLSFSIRTAHRHLASVRGKLDAHSTAELVGRAHEQGLLFPSCADD